MLIDEIHLKIKAGDGGNGIYHMYHDKMRPKGGPDGGNGGRGGDVYFVAVSDISRLGQFRHQTKFEAENGGNGGSNQKTGANGKDLILEVPVGSVITYDNGTGFEMTELGKQYIVAKGGRGGRGNYSFRSATNQQPEEFTLGQKLDYKNIFIQLKLIADIGLIGLPNAGKTSLLNELTSANAKIANYAFTTLEPNLGVTKSGKVIADIPGLIEGASQGKGLGFRFLKHIERTRLLVHCISSESENPQKDYQSVRTELENYSSLLAKKPEIVIITKSDLLEGQPEKLKHLFELVKPKLSVSIIDTDSLKKLNDLISGLS